MNDVRKTFWFLSFLFALSAVYTYYRTIGIIGPFIFADEFLYFSAARSIHDSMSFPVIAYNPLYSFLASFAIGGNIVQSYEIIRILNALLFASMIFPLFYIISSFFDKKTGFILTIGILLMPWGSITGLIWAESLFYPLYLWTVFVFLQFVQSKRFLYAILLGIFLALLFLTKQAGMVLSIAVFMALLFEYFIIDKERRNSAAYLTVPMVLLAIIAFWLVRNACFARIGLLGQPERISKFSTFSIFNIDYLNFGKAFLHQISYLAISSYMVFILVFAYSFLKLKSIGRAKRSFMFLILFAVAGTLFLNTLHRYYSATDETVYHLTYGRYMAHLIPLIIIAGLYAASAVELKLSDYLLISAVAVLMTFIIIVYSPLDSLGAYSVVNSADTAYLNRFIASEGRIDWGNRLECSLISRAYLGVFWLVFAGFMLIVLKLKRTEYAVLMILVPMIYTGLYADKYTEKIAISAEYLNQTERHLLESDMRHDRIFYDSQEKTPAFNYIHSFWYGERPEFLSFFSFPQIFDFGTKDSPVKTGALSVSAPWDENSSYTSSKGWGFTDLFNIDARHKIQRLFTDGSEDFVFGTKRQEFRIDCPAGEYILNISVNLTDSLITDDVGYNLTVNGDTPVEMIPDINSQINSTIQITNYGDYLSIIFEPVKAFWAINEMRISAKSSVLENLHNACFVTRQDIKAPDLTNEQRVRFDFGTPVSPVKQGALKVAAPWDGDAAYLSSKGWGFLDLYNMDSFSLPDSANSEGDGDFIFGTKTQEFRIDCPPGLYTIEVHLTPDAELEGLIEFLVVVNDSKSMQITPANDSKNVWTITVENKEKHLSILFSPIKKYWAVNSLEVIYKRNTSFDNPLWYAKRQKSGEFNIFSW